MMFGGEGRAPTTQIPYFPEFPFFPTTILLDHPQFLQVLSHFLHHKIIILTFIPYYNKIIII